VNFVAKHLKQKFAANPNYNPGSVWFGYPRGKGVLAGRGHPNDDALGNKVKPDGIGSSVEQTDALAQIGWTMLITAK
jgi:hypothetical protein